MKEPLAKKFCSCIKSVRKTVKARGSKQTKSAKESAAIAICTRSVLMKKRGRTLRKFKCIPKPYLRTQPLK